ncbi:MAG: NUDIX domain-containing protein [Clostridia bacterium]|nr:NUDIX domain-containing protein [Clostridia bacterium]
MELVERFDKKRIPLNKVVERYNPTKGEYEQSTHIWIMNSKGEFLMQKRSMQKKIHPGKWSVTGGAVDPGERPIDCIYRESKEEIGIDLDLDKVELMLSIKRKSAFIDIYLDREDLNANDLKLQKEEVDKVEWLNRAQIKELIDNGETANSIVKYFGLLCDLIDEEL